MTEDEVASSPGRQEILEQLERIVSSSLFRNSKRYPSLLRYIVDEALAGRSDALKERTLGICVFGRNLDYDTNADPVVRISAGEVRKRIAQYYQARGHEHKLRIEIPLGSYQPRFYRASDETWRTELQRDARSPAAVEALLEQDEPAAALPPPSLLAPAPEAVDLASSLPVDTPQIRLSRNTSGRLHFAVLYSLLFSALVPLGVLCWRTYETMHLPRGAELFWGRILRSPSPTLIVLGAHSFDPRGNEISYRSRVTLPQTQTLLWAMTRSDMVHLSDLTSYAGLTTLLTRHSHAFYTQGAADTTLEQLRRGPFMLVGGFNNLWTTTLTKQLRFRFVTLKSGRNTIQDSQHPERTWTLDANQSALSNTRDYGMVSCFFDQETSQYVLIAAGIGKSGTEAASDFLTNEQGLKAWFESTKASAGDNVQVVVSTDVIEGKPGSPQVVDSVRW